MKYLLTFLTVCLFSSGLYADTTFVSGTIVNQTWTTAGSPYAVEGDILVASLMIEPGVMVIFLGDYVFEIAGVLTAVGTAQDSIIFKRAASNGTGWQGIFFNFSVPGSELAYCRVEGAINSGIYIDNSLPLINNCTIINNSISGSLSNQGGGIYVLGTLTLNNCTIEGNSVSVISGNGVTRTAFGGGIYVSGTCNLSNCIIKDNSASVSLSGIFNSGTSRGGGIYVSGVFTVTNCIISNNIAIATQPTGIPTMEGGGAYFNASGSSSVTNSTIAYNTNEGLRSAGGGSVTVTNSIIYFNTPEANQIAGAPNVNYSDVQGGYTGTGNINSNPVFLSQTDLIIVVGSQCVDAGDPDPIYNDVCLPPSLGTERNDMGAHGGPGACGWSDLIIPVELTSFTANVSDADVLLNWTTATEVNNQRFEIERRSEEDQSITIGYVEGYGTTTEPKEYSYIDNTVGTGIYYYRLKQIDFSGQYEYSDEIEVEVNGPLTFALEQNYPNPFNPSTLIKYSVPENGFVKLSVYNLVGEEVSVLVNGTVDAGFYEVAFNAANLPSGTYFYRLQAGNTIQVKKMILLK